MIQGNPSLVSLVRISYPPLGIKEMVARIPKGDAAISLSPRHRKAMIQGNSSRDSLVEIRATHPFRTGTPAMRAQKIRLAPRHRVANGSKAKVDSKAHRGRDEEPHPRAGTRAYTAVRRGERRGSNKGVHMKASWSKTTAHV
jgi:hypothetical protein